MSSMNVGSKLRWSIDSTMTSWYHFHSTVTQNCQNLTQLQWCNSVRVHLYAYIPHWKVLKQFIYVHHGCGKQSKLVNSLGSASTGWVPSEDRSFTSSVSSTQKMLTLAAPLVMKWYFFFNQTLKGSYWELFEWNGLLRIGPEAIQKNGIFSCGPPKMRKKPL
jgi:hypothetical protein